LVPTWAAHPLGARATVAVLAMNLPDRVQLRAQLMAAGLFEWE
jgi:hypothetical protein